jgi:drug/metabolite transporter (DMT)-like permease
MWTSLTYVLCATSLFWLFVNSPIEIINAHYTFEDWKIFFVISTVSILIPYIFYFYGLRYIQPSKAIITSTLEPVVAILSEWLFLNGTFTLTQSAGAFLVLTAIVLLQKDSHSEEVNIAQE